MTTTTDYAGAVRQYRAALRQVARDYLRGGVDL